MKLNRFCVLGLYLDRFLAWVVLELLVLFQQSFIPNECYFQVLRLTVIVVCLLGFDFVRGVACANWCLRSVLTNFHLVVTILFLALAIMIEDQDCENDQAHQENEFNMIIGSQNVS